MLEATNIKHIYKTRRKNRTYGNTAKRKSIKSAAAKEKSPPPLVVALDVDVYKNKDEEEMKTIDHLLTIAESKCDNDQEEEDYEEEYSQEEAIY